MTPLKGQIIILLSLFVILLSSKNFVVAGGVRINTLEPTTQIDYKRFNILCHCHATCFHEETPLV